jgi:hypothetical protein
MTVQLVASKRKNISYLYSSIVEAPPEFTALKSESQAKRRRGKGRNQNVPRFDARVIVSLVKAKATIYVIVCNSIRKIRRLS